jgi:hypothetical protein
VLGVFITFNFGNLFCICSPKFSILHTKSDGGCYLHFVGGKWKMVVLWYLREDKKRFIKIKALMPQITAKMLSS